MSFSLLWSRMVGIMCAQVEEIVECLVPHLFLTPTTDLSNFDEGLLP